MKSERWEQHVLHNAWLHIKALERKIARVEKHGYQPQRLVELQVELQNAKDELFSRKFLTGSRPPP